MVKKSNTIKDFVDDLETLDSDKEIIEQESDILADENELEDTKNDTGETGLAIVGYLWLLFLVPMILKPESKFCQWHARQAMILFVIMMFFWFLPNLFWFGAGNVLYWFFRFVWGVVFLGYFAVMILCMTRAAKGEWYALPGLRPFLETKK